MYYTEGKFKQK